MHTTTGMQNRERQQDLHHQQQGSSSAAAAASNSMNEQLVIKDMREPCCVAWGVEARPDRPCMYLQHLLSADECTQLLEKYGSKHATEPESLEGGARSEFSHPDEDLCSLLWARIKDYLPQTLDGGECIGLR